MHHDCHDHALVPFWLSAVWLCMPEGRSWCCQTTRSKQQEPNHQMTLLTRLLFSCFVFVFFYLMWLLAGWLQPASQLQQAGAGTMICKCCNKKEGSACCP